MIEPSKPVDRSIRLKVAMAAYKADCIFWSDRSDDGSSKLDGVDLDAWFDTEASMPLSGPGFLRKWFGIADAILSLPEIYTLQGDRMVVAWLVEPKNGGRRAARIHRPHPDHDHRLTVTPLGRLHAAPPAQP